MTPTARFAYSRAVLSRFAALLGSGLTISHAADAMGVTQQAGSGYYKRLTELGDPRALAYEDRRPFRWNKIGDAALMDDVANGVSFSKIAAKLGVTKNAAIGRFHRLRDAMGWQAQ